MTRHVDSPRFELPALDLAQKDTKKVVVVCHFCGETGHKAIYCQRMGPVEGTSEPKLGVR